MGRIRLPKWVVSNDDSVRDEVAPYLGMSEADRLRLSRELCREAAAILRQRPDPDRWWEWVDPLPESTVAALRRLGMRGPGMP
jgi:hypothetical protein